MGTSLRKYKAQKKGSKLQDGFSVGGRGRLSDAVIDTFQNHYGNAIRKNSQDINECSKLFGLSSTTAFLAKMRLCFNSIGFVHRA